MPKIKEIIGHKFGKLTVLNTSETRGNRGQIRYDCICVCGGLVALTVGIAQKLNRITAVDFSTSAAITQNTCYAQCFLSNE